MLIYKLTIMKWNPKATHPLFDKALRFNNCSILPETAFSITAGCMCRTLCDLIPYSTNKKHKHTAFDSFTICKN